MIASRKRATKRWTADDIVRLNQRLSEAYRPGPLTRGQSRAERIVTRDLSAAVKKPAKYKNIKTTYNGIAFDSKAEARRYQDLLLAEQTGAITELKVHPKYSFDINGVHIGNYCADFAYTVPLVGDRVVEDVKQKHTRTTAYRLRKRLLKALHGLDVTEIG